MSTLDQRSFPDWRSLGIEPADAARWWEAGCWHPEAARELADAGLSPHQLIDADGRPKMIDALEDTPIALAVADGYITARQAMGLVEGRSSIRWSKS